jgi:hypothetical protein
MEAGRSPSRDRRPVAEPLPSTPIIGISNSSRPSVIDRPKNRIVRFIGIEF